MDTEEEFEEFIKKAIKNLDEDLEDVKIDFKEH